VGSRPDTVLVHGEDDAREAMARELRRRFDADVELARPDMARTVGR
jgi:metallo-beta-lactamase family protein